MQGDRGLRGSRPRALAQPFAQQEEAATHPQHGHLDPQRVVDQAHQQGGADDGQGETLQAPSQAAEHSLYRTEHDGPLDAVPLDDAV